MSAFWTKCFRRTYQAFTTDYYAGRSAVEWWLSRAEEKRLIAWNQLDVTTLTAIWRIASASTTIGNRARVLSNRKDSPFPNLASFERPDHRLANSSFSLDRSDELRRALGMRGIVQLYWEGISDFLCWLYFLSPTDAQQFAANVLMESYETWNYLEGSFEVHLLCEMQYELERLNWPRPESMPNPLPPWINSLSQEEKVFLNLTLNLDRPEREILLLTVCAGMTPREIAPSLFSHERPWNPKIVECKLHLAWEEVFAQL